MLTSPILILSRMIVKFLIRNVSLNFINHLTSLVFSLVRNVGIIPAFSFVRSFIYFLISRPSEGYSVRAINLLGSLNIHPMFLAQLRTLLQENLISINSIDPNGILTLRRVLYVLIFFFSLNPLTVRLVRIFLWIFLTALGISINTVLSSYQFLKYFSDFVIDITGIKPINKERLLKVSRWLTRKDVESTDFSVWFYISIFVLGALTVTGIILLMDRFIPETVRSIPYVPGTLDGFYEIWSKTLEGFYNICGSVGDIFQRWNPWRTGQVGRDGIVGLEDLPPFNDGLTPPSSPISTGSAGSSDSSSSTIRLFSNSLLNSQGNTTLNIPDEIPEYINNPFSG